MKDKLNLVFNSENSALKLYELLCEKSEIFARIKEIRYSGIKLLEDLAELRKCELNKVDDIPFLIPDEFEDILIYLINYENLLCKTYEQFTDEIGDEQLRDICFRLWATSNNEYIPALKDCLKFGTSEKNNENFKLNSDEFKNSLDGYQQNFANISEKLQNALNGKLDKKELSEILNSPNFSFFSGLAIGALGASLLAKKFKDEEK